MAEEPQPLFNDSISAILIDQVLAEQAKEHECLRPGCRRLVPYARFACRTHWFKLPRPLRERIKSSWRNRIWTAHHATMAEALEFYQGGVGD